MKATVDRETCIGCELCVTICPDLFTIDEDNKAVVLVELLPAQSETCAKAAELGCPVSAITVV
jgi:ferredoxin